MGGYITMETLNSINIPKRKENSHKGDMAKFY
ncbi:sugar kinase [Staphylococcus aureus]|uniref:Sugar kinase n=1 Tax=Staphylococcus aureus TaxID=1280 RepID=A0AB72YTS5_STAAU|nr:sugar kinase [Staphylococcus aureus]